jgi:hypothetical protein
MAEIGSAVWSEPWEVDRRLSELGEGLSRELLRELIMRAQAAYAASTPHHPRNFASISRWGNGIASMRDLLVPFAWVAVDRSGQPLILNPAGNLAITISGADEYAGRDGDRQPRSTAKGAVTIRAVERNAMLFADWEKEARAEDEAAEIVARNTWFLLMHLDKSAHQLRAELSHPTGLDIDRRISRWSERILLSPLDIDPTISDSLVDDEGPDDGDVTIEFKRRA